jgi:Gas vesicle synthesis protein GvpL/GvpF
MRADGSMYTYAFLLSDVPLDLPEGIWGSLELVTLDRLAALVEPDLPLAILQQTDRQLMQAVLSHDRVIQELFQQTTVLPLRFGTCFVSRQRLLEHLQFHQIEYLEKLARLQGKAEYAVKLTPLSFPDFSIPTDLQGKDYFLAKKRLYQDQVEWQQQQQQELLRLQQLIQERYANAVRGSETEDGIERIYLLHSHQAEQQLQTHLADWQEQSRCWSLTLGDMLPPYHFV